MAKNNSYINQCKDIARYMGLDRHTIMIMSAFCLVLHKYGELEQDDIVYLMGKVQEEIDKSVNEGYNLADLCEEVTNIDVRQRQ